MLLWLTDSYFYCHVFCATDCIASCFHLPCNDFLKNPPASDSDATDGNSSVVADTTENGGQSPLCILQVSVFIVSSQWVRVIVVMLLRWTVIFISRSWDSRHIKWANWVHCWVADKVIFVQMIDQKPWNAQSWNLACNCSLVGGWCPCIFFIRTDQ